MNALLFPFILLGYALGLCLTLLVMIISDKIKERRQASNMRKYEANPTPENADKYGIWIMSDKHFAGAPASFYLTRRVISLTE